MEKKNIVKLGAAISVAALLVGAGVTGALVENTWSATVEGLGGQISELTNLNLDQVNVIDNLNLEIARLNAIEPEVINNTVEVEVEVDNGNLDLVLEHIYDNDGKINYLLDDLDDDELNLIVDRIIFINDIKSLAVQEAEKEIKDLLDKEDFVFGNETITFDEDDIERVRVQDDAEDVIIDDVDFEDSDAEVMVEVHFEQDDVKYKALTTVEFKDGEVDDIDLESVKLR